MGAPASGAEDDAGGERRRRLASTRATAAIAIRTTPEAAFDAWLDPRQAARFLAPHPTTVGEFTNDPREGGAFRLIMEGAGERFEHSAATS